MNRVYLTVPFEEKDQAKRLGARWDNGRRQWYVPETASLNLFAAWVSHDTPGEMDQVMVEVAYVAETFYTCWKCSTPSQVISLASDCHHYFDTPWQPYPLLFSCVTQIPDEMAKCLKPYSFYYLSVSKSQGVAQWRNHCPQCRAAQGDSFLYGEPGDPFNLTTSFEAADVKLRRLDCPPGVISCLVVVGQPADLIFADARRVQ